MKPPTAAESALRTDIAACTVCAPHLAAGPRPIVRFGAAARLLIIGQAPGSKVHASGVPWDDRSGDRLREWTGLSKADFYDSRKVALMPMGFCYPGKGKSGDLPPRKECAPLWHDAILGLLPHDRLTLLVGSYAQAYYMPQDAGLSLAQRVAAFTSYLPRFFPLPHPSWRSTNWMQDNDWFERNVLPALREAVRKHAGRDDE
jgi:uracil-DNA glycosylase